MRPHELPGATVVEQHGEAARTSLVEVLDFGQMAARLTIRGRAAYGRDETLRLASEGVLYRILGAIDRLPAELIEQHPEVPWRALQSCRTPSGRIDHDALWEALDERLPDLRRRIVRILTD